MNTIFLDRDGVINQLVGEKQNRGPRTVSELLIRPDFQNFIGQLHHLPIQFVVVTNQPDLSRGKLSQIDNELIKTAILSELPHGTLYLECPHDNNEGCDCRKPKNGMIENGLRLTGANREHSLLIGDTWTDIVAGQSSFIYSILLNRVGSLSATSQGSPPENFHPNETVEHLIDLLFRENFIKRISQ